MNSRYLFMSPRKLSLSSSLSKKILLPFILLLITMAGISQGANIIVSPTTTNVAAGATFTVKLRVQILSGDLDAAEVHLDFDNTKLSVTSVAPSAGNPLGSQLLALESVSTINTNGHLHYAAFTTSGFPTTSFDFVDVTFLVNNAAPSGVTPLTFTTVFPHATGIERAGSSVLNTIVNGSVNIAAACTPPTATISNTATCNGQSFNLVLQSATGTAPFDLVINGNTYNNVNIGGVITTIAPPNENLWTPADAPSDLDLNDASDIEVGTKFTASVNGFVRGVRFYKGPTSSGTFTGKLYDFNNPATPLANANFVTSPSGWQQVLFSSPVAITAGTTYVVSVYSSTGDYSSSDGYFNVPLVSGSLTAPAGDNGTTSSSNGLYLYGSGMPINSYNNSSYFVDVVFTPASFTYNLTSVTGDDGCIATGALQTLTVNSPACSTLPVTLLGLSATPQDNSKVIVKWSTSSEINNKGFEVQRSLDGRNNWQTIAFVQGAGDSYSVKNYSYTDGNLVARRYFYQLKQVDIDGRYKYSMVVSANLSTRDGYSLEQNFPNPTGGSQYTTIRFTLPRRTNVTLSLYDLSGRLIQTLATGNRDAGTHAIPFDPSKLSTGLYYYKLQTEDFTDTKKMTVR
jgi:hypothetical protein